jgi:hypothetical protein
MLAGVCRLVAALAIVGVVYTASAQVIPPSAQPGRERERFTEPPVPRALPGGPAIRFQSSKSRLAPKKSKLSRPRIRDESDLRP